MFYPKIVRLLSQHDLVVVILRGLWLVGKLRTVCHNESTCKVIQDSGCRNYYVHIHVLVSAPYALVNKVYYKPGKYNVTIDVWNDLGTAYYECVILVEVPPTNVQVLVWKHLFFNPLEIVSANILCYVIGRENGYKAYGVV